MEKNSPGTGAFSFECDREKVAGIVRHLVKQKLLLLPEEASSSLGKLLYFYGYLSPRRNRYLMLNTIPTMDQEGGLGQLPFPSERTGPDLPASAH